MHWFTPTWLSPMLVQHDDVGEVVAATGLDELVEDHASAIDALGVGEDQLHLLCVCACTSERRDLQPHNSDTCSLGLHISH